jgi:SAM-dependent methyltransferase
MDKEILDVCCGAKMFWFDKNNPDVLFCDIRQEEHILCDGRKLEIKPDMVMDFRNLEFPDNHFKLVVFDPPHLTNPGQNSWMAKKYGRLDKEWREYLKRGFDECWRVLKQDGILIFKWSERNIKVSEILNVVERTPLFGHKTTQHSTHWLCFMKRVTD